jgi:hypothetical protein
MSRVALLLSLMACQTDPSALPGDQLPPPFGLELDGGVFIPGASATVRVTDAPAGSVVRLWATLSSTGPDACPPVLNGRCLDLPGPVVQIGQRNANGQGAASFTLTPPPNLRPGPVALQATAGAGTFSPQSDFLLTQILPDFGDADGDQLDNAGEVAAGTDPLDPDTDDDGLLDGEEAFVWNTDPRSPDTDGGGTPDGEEIALATDPLDPADDCQFSPDPANAIGEPAVYAGTTAAINALRADVGVAPVVWDTNLAASALSAAQTMANSCSFTAQTPSGIGRTAFSSSVADLPRAVAFWGCQRYFHDPLDEVPTCSYAPPETPVVSIPPECINPLASSSSCLNYSQMVWSTTSEVGCAYASNPACSGASTYHVCFWDTQGNITGQTAYPPSTDACVDQDHDDVRAGSDADDLDATAQ